MLKTAILAAILAATLIPPAFACDDDGQTAAAIKEQTEVICEANGGHYSYFGGCIK